MEDAPYRAAFEPLRIRCKQQLLGGHLQHRVLCQRAKPAARRQTGFTLIELMIVVAIVGILSAVTIPQYQDYMARAQFSEAPTLASAQKVAVVETFSDQGSCPNNASAEVNGIPKAEDINGKYIKSVTTGGTVANSGGCTITAAFNDKNVSRALEKKYVTLTMTNADKGAVGWVCQSDAEQRYMPQACTKLTAGK